MLKPYTGTISESIIRNNFSNSRLKIDNFKVVFYVAASNRSFLRYSVHVY